MTTEELNDLGAPVRLQHLAENYKNVTVAMRAETSRHDKNKNILIPRFGLAGQHLRTMPVFVYDTPSLNKICRTAFTTGRGIWIHAKYLEQGEAEERESMGALRFGVPLLIHEVGHALFDDVIRLLNFPRKAANWAADIKLDPIVRDLIGGATLARCFDVGSTLRQGAKIQTDKEATEVLARNLALCDIDKSVSGSGSDDAAESQMPSKKKATGKSGRSQKSKGKAGTSAGQGETGQGGEGDPQEGDDQPDNGNDPSGVFGAEDDEHLVTESQVAAALLADGRRQAMEARGIPEPGDTDKHRKNTEQVRASIAQSLEQARQQSERVSHYPGQHMIDHVKDILDRLTEGRVSWIMKLSQLVFGDGLRSKRDMDVYGDLYPISEIEQTVGTALWGDGQLIAATTRRLVIWIQDTSGSMSMSEEIQEGISEAFRLARQAQSIEGGPSAVLVFMADTETRGEPIAVNEHNWRNHLAKGVAISGRGGTDMENAIRNVLVSKEVTRHRADEFDIIVATDAGTAPPKFSLKDLNGRKCTLTYLIPPASHVNDEYIRGFRAAVEPTGAKVYAIPPNTRQFEVDLRKNTRLQATA